MEKCTCKTFFIALVSVDCEFISSEMRLSAYDALMLLNVGQSYSADSLRLFPMSMGTCTPFPA